MTRTEFMAALRGRLSHLPPEEQDAALRYYEEYFDEAASEEEAARQLGSPEDIAARILGESAQPSADPQPQTAPPQTAQPQPAPLQKQGHSAWFWVGIVTLCVFASPVLLGLGAAALGIAVAVAAVVLALIVAAVSPFLVMSVAMLATCVVCLYLAAGAAGVFAPGAVLLCGVGLLCGALGVLSGIFTGYLCCWIGLLFRAIFGGFRRKGARA